MSQRSIAAYATRRPYDSTPFLSHARSGILPGGGSRQAQLLFDEALREKVFFGYQVLIQVSRTRGTPCLLFRCSTFNKDFVQVNDNAHVALSFYGVGAFDFIQTIEKRKRKYQVQGIVARLLSN